MDKLYILKNKIINRSGKTIGYKLQFSEDKNDFSHKDRSTSKLMATILNDISIDKLLEGTSKGFIEINNNFLTSKNLNIMDKNRFIFQIPPVFLVNEENIEILKKLKLKGYRFSLDNFNFNTMMLKKFAKIIPHCSLIHVNTLGLDHHNFQKYKETIEGYNVQYVAMYTNSKDDYKKLSKCGYKFFQGEVTGQAEIITHLKYENNSVPIILNILDLLKKDVDIPIIEDVFNKNMELTFKLIRFLNNDISIVQHITSIKHALTLLGRSKLAHWLLIYMFAQFEGDGISQDIVDRAMKRAEELSNKVEKNKKNSAYMVGILSLMPVALKQDSETVFSNMKLDLSIKDALIAKKGPFGELLKEIEDVEKEKMKELFLANFETIDFEEFAKFSKEQGYS